MSLDALDALRQPELSRFFKDTYESSRETFMRSTDLIGLPRQVRSWNLPGHSELATDCVWIGDVQANNVLVLISGTHGVEGYCGSAVQSFLLECLSRNRLSLPNKCAVLMVHALNPWGMKWVRRCDQEGIDLNRNFIDFARIPETDPRYHSLLEILMFSKTELRQTELAMLEAEWGREVFERVLSSGQYSYSWAPFFGGIKPAFASYVTDEIIANWGLESRLMTVVDLHTGLGPWGYGELISDHPLNCAGNQFAHDLFGLAVAETLKGESYSVVKSGLLDYRWHTAMANGCFLTLEFGTYGTEALFNVLINDHLLWRGHKNGCSETPVFMSQRKAMLNHFCPQDRLWQQSVLFRSWQVASRALEHMSALSS